MLIPGNCRIAYFQFQDDCDYDCEERSDYEIHFALTLSTRVILLPQAHVLHNLAVLRSCGQGWIGGKWIETGQFGDDAFRKSPRIKI